MRDGFRWSPDGRRIAYWQFDTSGVGIFTLLNNTDSVYPVATRSRIPRPARPTRRRASASSRPTAATRPGCRRRAIRATATWRGWSGRTTRDARHPAAEPAAEPAGRDDRRRRTGRVSRVFRDRVRDLGRRRGHGALGRPGRKLHVDQRARRLAAHLPLPREGGTSTTLVDQVRRRRRAVLGIDDGDEWLYFTASPDNPTSATCTAPDSTARARRSE